MAEETKQLPAPEDQNDGDWLIPILVFFGAFVIILLLLLPGNPAAAPDELTIADKQDTTASGASQAPASGRVEFVQPEDGAEVPTTFTVSFAADNLIVEPAGPIREGAGHFHVLINEPFVEAGEIIPNNETHRHFGTGAFNAELTLEPGTYTLRLQFADGAHRALEGDGYRDEITVTVVGE
jgi:hypothetical protein